MAPVEKEEYELRDALKELAVSETVPTPGARGAENALEGEKREIQPKAE